MSLDFFIGHNLFGLVTTMEMQAFLSSNTFECLADSTMERLAGQGWDGMGGPGELVAALGLI